jgi:7-alpha-hydroxysteroid dehydrogenase
MRVCVLERGSDRNDNNDTHAGGGLGLSPLSATSSSRSTIVAATDANLPEASRRDTYYQRMKTLDAFSLRGRVALVTGAGRGIGEAIARAFAGAGSAVALVARTQGVIEAVARDIRAAGGQAVALPADVTDLTRLPSLVKGTIAAFGGLDILVNNAGGEVTPAFRETRVEHLEAAFHFNVSVPFELSRHAVPHLLERPGASIINISSIVVGKQVRGHLAHHVGKAAEAQLTLSMAADLGPRIRVNALLPAQVETEQFREYLHTKDPHLLETLIERTRMRRNATPHDVAYAAVYLASPAASWVTGILHHVDGGAVDEIRSMGPDL